VPVILVDCDGNVEQFIPLVLEGGLNGLLPFEVAAGNDVREVRRRYGDLVIFGGIDKRALAKGKAAIDEELSTKVRPMLAEGGYFPMLDHYAPPDISFENYLYYKMKLKCMRRAG
jgi:uroporphyrinogen decarboxylase